MGLCIPVLWIPHRGKQAPLEQVAHCPEVMSTATWQSPSGILALSVGQAREGDDGSMGAVSKARRDGGC